MKDVKQILTSKELQEAIDKFCNMNEIDIESDEGSNQVECFIIGYIAAKNQ